MFYGTYKLMMDRFPSVSHHNKLDTGSHASADIAGRRRTRQILLAKSDRLLADMGFSRERLEQGVQAWPWRVESAPTAELSASVPSATLTPRHETTAGVPHQWMDEQRYAA